MHQFQVTGMSCAACSARVEKAVAAVRGVRECSVNLLTGSMSVVGEATPEVIIAAVEHAGYGATLKEKTSAAPRASEQSAPTLPDGKKEQRVLQLRLIFSLVLLAPLMYLSMFSTMWGAPLPAYLQQNPTVVALLQLLLATAVMVINQKFFVSGFMGLIHGAPNMDTLVSLGSAASYLYSLYLLVTMCEVRAAAEHLQHTLHGLYFESAAMILALITLGKLLESRAKGKTTDALRSLMDLSPKTAVLERDGQEVRVPIAEVRTGDIFVVRPGESIPVDGVILEGTAAINESALTGESVPVDKGIGDHVSAATHNQTGVLRCRAERVGEDTTIAQIIRMVSDASAGKAPIAKLADKVSGIFVPVVLSIAAVTLLAWLTVGGESLGYAMARAISVLVISCPCALGLATPVAIMVGSGMGAKHGILFKTAAALEQTGRTCVVVLDKTGTITKGEPHVTDLHPAEGRSAVELLQWAATLERSSEHPLGKAVVQEAGRRMLPIKETTDFTALSGSGLRASVAVQGSNVTLLGGRQSLIDEYLAAPLPENVLQTAQNLADQGKTPLFFAMDGTYLGMIAVADVIKPDSPWAVRALRSMGMHVVMLTGDNERTAKAIGAQVQPDEIIAGVLPQQKEEVIRRLQQRGKVAMVGDGINDAPALARADIGIAIGAGTDVAIDVADVVLVNSRLQDVVAAIALSRKTLRNIRENLFWAFFYNCIGIPLAAGAFVSVFGWELNPMFGALAMSLSSFCVVSNALRLRRFRAPTPHEIELQTADAVENLQENKENLTMNISMTIKIEGMMCPHCSGRVKKLLEALDEITLAEVSHESGTAVITATADDADALRAKCAEVITEAGYTVVG